MSDHGEPIPGINGDATTVLLTGPLMSTADEQACVGLLDHPWSHGDSPSDSEQDATVDVVFVSFNRSPDECIELWQTHTGIQAERIGVISVGDRGRFSDVTEVNMELPSSPVEIMSVRDPRDLPRIGLTLNAHLAEFEDDPRPTVVCFHSVTALLQYVDQERAFRFIRILSAYLDSADAVAHYHMDPSAHPDQVVATFRPLFDAVVDSGQIVAHATEPGSPVADAPTITDDQTDHGPITSPGLPDRARDAPGEDAPDEPVGSDGTAKRPGESPDSPEPDDTSPVEPPPDDADDESGSAESVGDFVFVGDLSSEEAPVNTVETGPDTTSIEADASVGEPTVEDGVGTGDWMEAFDTIMNGPTVLGRGEPSDATEGSIELDRAAATEEPTESAAATEGTGERTAYFREVAKPMLSLGLFATGIILVTLGIQASVGTSPLVEQFVAFVAQHPTIVFSGAGVIIGGIGLALILADSLNRE